MDTREDRWFVRFRGHTLGPLSTHQVRASLRKKEIGPADKLASAKEPAWKPLSAHAEFAGLWEEASSLETLAPPPSPRFLWKKNRAPLPSAPEEKVAATEAQTEPVMPAVPKVLPVAEPAALPVTEPASPRAAAPVISPAVKTGNKKKKGKTAKAKKAAPTAARAASPASRPVAPAKEAPLPVEALSLMEVLRDWREQEEKIPAALRFARPESQTFVPPERQSSVLPTHATPAAPPKSPRRPLELHLTVSKQFLAVSGLVAALMIVAIVLALNGPKKMRDLESFRLPDPSSPTIQPSAPDDPVPALKAPTRPQRD